MITGQKHESLLGLVANMAEAAFIVSCVWRSGRWAARPHVPGLGDEGPDQRTGGGRLAGRKDRRVAGLAAYRQAIKRRHQHYLCVGD